MLAFLVELAMVAKRFRKLMGQRDRRLAKKGYKREQSSSWKNISKNDSNKKEDIICYECKKPGHFRSECPMLKEETPKKNKKSKKAMVVATWSDSDVLSSDVEEEKVERRANLCLMARDDESGYLLLLVIFQLMKFKNNMNASMMNLKSWHQNIRL
ncbi:Uncharacterized protein TCM_024059 [Theobroma cacao]|uniref:CCHC-type domain-containing protein n=1 Tax=Theobroma cacao TaxID=3641 RepID=A0A061EVZ8_THECC|nr:Uncharacterized protein TCM_024059 [Theobroma cacao]